MVQIYTTEIQIEIIKRLKNAKKFIRIAMAYFNDHDIINILTSLLPNIHIEIILNEKVDDEKSSINKFVGFKHIFVYEETDEKMMHHKICIIDNETIIVGSYNWTHRAKKNYESIIIFDQVTNDILDIYTSEFEKIKENALTKDVFIKKHQFKAKGEKYKLPPQAIDMEESVLGTLMIEKDALNLVIDTLRPESFYKPAHQEIYRAIFDLFASSQPIDFKMVVQQLRKNGKIDLVGGANYVMNLTSSVQSSTNIEAHARIITEQAIKRECIRIFSNGISNFYNEEKDIFDLLDQAEQKLFQVSESNIRKQYSPMSSLVLQALKELENRRQLKDGLTGVPTGFSDLDRITGGFQKSDLIILAASPAMGKTAFALSIFRNAAVDFGKPCAFFSLEMSEIQLTNRLLSGEAEIESEKIRRGRMEEYEWVRIHEKTEKLRNAPFFIDDTPAISLLELRAKCRRLKAQHDIQLIMVDYLQLMTASTGKNTMGNREQEISTISRGLKMIAKELNVPVIALAQLSRAVETRGGEKKPQLSDLRESGSLEQDADIVIFLYRPEYYGFATDAEGNNTKDIGEVIIAKHRNGSLDTVKLKFIGKYTKFENLENANFVPRTNTTLTQPVFNFESKINNVNSAQNNNTQNTNNNTQDMSGFQKNTPRLDDEPPF